MKHTWEGNVRELKHTEDDKVIATAPETSPSSFCQRGTAIVDT
ncbi:MAG: hypothetical protein AAB344_08325 [Bacteroidota bacterium]|jgi:DNA-binding NtrC family response regulator